MEFTKMHGNGNDFIVIDDRKEEYLNKEEALARELCHRHFGVGADGILIVRNSKSYDAKMLIYNADGSMATMCGNGIRCFAKYIWDSIDLKKNPLTIETGDGVKQAFLTINQNKVVETTINMGIPSFSPKDFYASSEEDVIDKVIHIDGVEYKITSMLMGVPHTVIFGQLDSFSMDQGKLIEKYSFFEKGTNVNFAQIVSKNEIRVKTWERGAGSTLACGTGCCAAVVAASKLGLGDNKMLVQVPGGTMSVEIKSDGVMMTGPAKTIFRGEYYR